MNSLQKSYLSAVAQFLCARAKLAPREQHQSFLDRARLFCGAQSMKELGAALRDWETKPDTRGDSAVETAREITNAASSWRLQACESKHFEIKLQGELLGIPVFWRDQIANADSVELTIDSPGGDSSAGLELLRLIGSKPCSVLVTGTAASAAALLAVLVKGKRQMLRGGKLMFHRACIGALATSARLRALADELDRLDDEVIDLLAARTGQPVSTVRAWHSDGTDTWFDARQAMRFGLVDEIRL